MGATAEAIEFISTIAEARPDAVTACDGWTVHDLTAHVAAGGAEIARVVRASLDGDPAPETRGFGPREAPYRELAPSALRDRLVAGGPEVVEALGRLRALGSDASVPFTGWEMTATMLATHVRSELALHRWDVAGDDDVSFEVLSRAELTAHAVAALNAFGTLRESPGARARAASLARDVEARLRCEGRDDVVLSLRSGIARFDLAPPEDGPALHLDPAARLLMLWGRKPSGAHAMHSTLAPGDLAALHRWLYA